ncbi:MAG: hypothetical protein D3909_04825 [Candidatus Electrothrix sp. ATG1]|nr:hypothetical protein [Candidatus Electrothrix sp. ATG1]
MEEDLNSEIKLMISRELMTRVMKKLGLLERIKKKKAAKPKKRTACMYPSDRSRYSLTGTKPSALPVARC